VLSTTHVRRVGAPLRRLAIGWRTQSWPAYSRLFVAGDGNRWAIADDAAEVAGLAPNLGIRVGPERWIARVRNQSIFHTSQFTLIGLPFERAGNRLGVAYLHGRPRTPGMPEFDTCYETVRRRHEELDRVQVSNHAMEELVLGTGIAPEKVFRIPIGVDTVRFHARDAESRAQARGEFDLPESAFVVGSFQKDGVGWGEGLEPKLIKGPDVLLDVAERLACEVPELVVLLTGPARGYVRAGLERLGIPSRHVLLPDLDAVARAYRAIDLCLVTSRDEGGPKAVLESMATGVPLVTTRVGQAADLVRTGENGWLCEVEDAEGLAAAAVHVAHAPAAELEPVVATGVETAAACSWEALRPRWSALFRGFVAMEDV
jgi:glycosyltransferase involved in cell wall biosynthesis